MAAAMGLLWYRHGPWLHHGRAMAVPWWPPWRSHGTAMGHGSAMAVPWQCHGGRHGASREDAQQPYKNTHRREAGLERLAPIYSRRRPAAYMPYETRSRRDAGPPAEERLASRGWLSLSPTPGCIRAIQHHKQKRCTGLQAAIWKCILSCSRSVHLSDILLH